MTVSLTSATRLLALLGDPVGHSLSPRFQNAAIAATGVDGVYLALRCVADDVPGLLRGIARSGGGGNVTVPHKEVAARVIDRPTDAVLRTGACNTFWGEDGDVCGDNTDVAGFAAAVGTLLGRSLSGARVLLVGAGGGAAAAADAMTRDGADEVVIVNRTGRAARDLAGRFASSPTSFVVSESVHSLRGERFDLAVNATSLGLRQQDAPPIAPDAGVTFGAAFDLVYRPDCTSWIRAQQALGIPAADGLEMLLHQGAAAFTRWWGITAPLAVMRAALPNR